MELVKQNENYTFSDKLENGWVVNGNASHEADGALSLSINIGLELGDHIGDFYYHKPVEGNIHMNYNLPENKRDEIIAYADSVIDFVLAKLA